MKKNLLLLVLALIGMGGFTACNNEDGLLVQEQTNTKPVVIRATIGNVSRLALGDSEGGQTKLSWGTGDAFALTIGDNSYTFEWVSGNYFEYNGSGFPETFADAGIITATYPATAAGELSVQSGTKANVGNYMQMTASKEVTAGQSTTDLNLSFEHHTSVVEIALEKSELASQSVVVDLRTIAESMYSTPADGEGVLSFDSDGKLTVYFAVSPTNETIKDWHIGVKYIDGNDYYTATLSEMKLAASKMYKVNKDALTPSYLVSDDSKTVTAYNAIGLYKWAEMAMVDLDNTVVNLELGADITLSTEGITLTGDLPDKGNWTPVGNLNYDYQGTIDGKNHIIKNMYIVNKNNTVNRIGFLGSSNGATIKNLKFDNAKIVVGQASGKVNNVGVISGYSRSNIDDCHVTNSVVKCLGESELTTALGGLVGSMSPNNANGDTKRITNSSFSGTVDGNEQVGGIVGNLQSWQKGYAFVTGCTVEGTVTGEYMVGGIAGRSGQFTGTAGSSFLGYVSAIEMCTNEATVTGAASGGIVGYQSNYGYAIGCTNQGEIHGTSISIGATTKSGTGGIVGLIEHYGDEDDALKMSYVIGCRNLSTKVYSSADDSYIGGVVGYQNREKSAIYGSYTVASEENAAYLKHAQQAIGTAFTGGLYSYTEGNFTFASVSAVTADDFSTMNTAITSGFNTAKNYFYKDDKSAYKDYRWSWAPGSGIWPEFKASVTP